MTIQIRKTTIADVPALRAFQEEAWFTDYKDLVPEDYAHYAINLYGTVEFLTQQVDTVHIYRVAEVDNQVVACINADILNENEMWWIHTSGAYRGRGIGRLLIDDVMRELKGKVPTLYVTTFQNYTPTLAFYNRLGFREQKKFIYEVEHFKIPEIRLFRAIT